MHRRPQAVKWAFILAPCLVVAPALIIFAVDPDRPAGRRPRRPILVHHRRQRRLLFVIALASIGVYGIILGGWSSNNKFSLLGGLRSAAQMISYEVPQGLSIVGPLMLAGTMSLVGIVEAPASEHAALVRLPAARRLLHLPRRRRRGDRTATRSTCPEAESELVAGFHTEYSGMRFALFFLGEYANMIVISAVATTLFLGGWLRPFPNWDGARLPRRGARGRSGSSLKVVVFLFVYIWFRGTFPRYRFDQLMDLGWKWMIPLALANLVRHRR